MIKVQVHQRFLGAYHHEYHCWIANSIPESTQESIQLLSSSVRIWDMRSLVRGRATACAGISLSFRHISYRHPRASETEMRLGYSWRDCTFCRWVCPGLWLNIGRLWLNMNFSFQLGHASTATISLRSTCTSLHTVRFILVCFILIMFSLALNQWTLCSQIVIYQDTAYWGTGGSSRLATAHISIYTQSLCDGCRWNALYC